jgi:threonine dehydrogenase-like Zn-dependent dehydrogenase
VQVLQNQQKDMESHTKKDSDKILEILMDYKNSSNKDLEFALDFIAKDFYKTRDLIVKLTKHLDSSENSYNKLKEEYKKRMNNV